MIIEKEFFLNNKSQKIAAKIYKATPASMNGVIFCHGLFSTKDGYKITRLAEDIVNAGFTLLTFDFSFVGESEGNISELSILQEVDDLNGAFSFFQKYGILNTHLIGSSMGALVSLLFSSVMGSRLCSQTLIAAPVLLHQITRNMAGLDVDTLPENGQTTVDGIPINNKFFREAMKIDIEKVFMNTTVPTLVIHGGKDEVVPVTNAAVLIKNLNCEKRVVLIQDGDHNLSRDSDLDILRENILEWIKEHSIQV
jgi:pimeloyl-ACP methyl ester carboxylesterase